jgi:hypothetical protein
MSDCPNAQPTIDLVRYVVASHGWDASVEAIVVTAPEEASRLGFLGSPTVQVDGCDVDPAARGSTDFAMACRLYGSSGIPPSAMIVAAIRDALAGPSVADATPSQPEV